MASLFDRQLEIGFGPSRVSGKTPCAPVVVRASDEETLRESVRSECPPAAGVYGMFDEDGRWIYVGKSKRLKARLLSYFRAKSRASKERRILDRTVGIGWERTPSEFGALLRELELIQRWRPTYNVKGQPGSRTSTYLCVGKPPAPYVYLSDAPGKEANGWYGPLPATRRAADAARRLNDYFGLRDCPKPVDLSFADQQELFPILRSAGCLRYELQNCLGPCIGACTKSEYASRVRSVRAYLRGDDSAPIQSLEREIEAAAAILQFERAATLHVLLGELRWILEHLGRLRMARGEYSFVYPHRGVWHLIRSGVVIEAFSQPRDAAGASKALERLECIFLTPPTASGRSEVRDLDMLLLVSSWFRQHPTHLERTLSLKETTAHLQKLADGKRAIVAQPSKTSPKTAARASRRAG